MKKVIALLLTFAVLLSFSGCFSMPDGSGPAVNNNADITQNADAETKPAASTGDPRDAKLVSTKIETVKGSITEWNDNSGVIKKDDEFAFVSCEGKISENTYVSVEYIDGDYYAVSDVTEYASTAPADINIFGVANVDGELIIEKEYASIDYLNERFLKVITVTEITENEDDAIIYLTSNMFSIGGPSEGDTLYKGKWQIYDIEAQQFVPGLSGTTSANLYAYGNMIEVGIGDIYTADGEKMPEGTDVLENGYYTILDDNYIETLYNTDGEEVYVLEEDCGIYESCTSSPEYFIMTDRSGSSNVYMIIDETGKVYTRTDKTVTDLLFGKVVVFYENSSYGLLDFDGNVVAASEYRYINSDKTFNIEIIALVTNTNVKYIYPNGEVAAETIISDALDVYNMVTEKEDDVSGSCCFNLKTGAFDIVNSKVCYNMNWVAEVEKEIGNDDYSGIVDTISGEEIIDCKYARITFLEKHIVCSYRDGDKVAYDFYEIAAAY